MPRRPKRLRAKRRPLLYVKQILAWADAFHDKTGEWPSHGSGPVAGTVDEVWGNIDMALREGRRGLRPGSSLSRLMTVHRGHRNRKALPPLKITDILRWADAHFRRTGSWPTRTCGPIADAPGETWHAVDSALFAGIRGQPGGSSLARLLAKRRGVRNDKALPPFTVKQILAWADAFHRRTGQWPKANSGPVAAGVAETWNAVSSALLNGRRGLKGGSSLARLLARHRGVRNEKGLPALTEDRILAWADDHHRRAGQWPTRFSGDIAGAPGERWSAVHVALSDGRRGLPGGSSLARLLLERRDHKPTRLPPLSIDQILAWADAYRRNTARWPTHESGAIPGTDEDWRNIDGCLRSGLRGLQPGSSLSRLLAEHRGHRNRKALPPLDVDRILRWADAHFRRTQSWPTSASGPIVDAPGETWSGVSTALHAGIRGLPGSSSLPRLLAEHRGVRNIHDLPRLTIKQILEWADRHHRRTGLWPKEKSGPVADVPGETWQNIDLALRNGRRGLMPGSSLPRLLAKYRGVPNIHAKPPHKT